MGDKKDMMKTMREKRANKPLEEALWAHDVGVSTSGPPCVFIVIEMSVGFSTQPVTVLITPVITYTTTTVITVNFVSLDISTYGITCTFSL